MRRNIRLEGYDFWYLLTAAASDATADERPRPALLIIGTVAINVLATSAVVLVTGRSRWRRAPRSDAYDPIA